ncbi:MAG: hypothetical protein ACERKO_12235, partial [Acetanaerobacterium sp.]
MDTVTIAMIVLMIALCMLMMAVAVICVAVAVKITASPTIEEDISKERGIAPEKPSAEQKQIKIQLENLLAY